MEVLKEKVKVHFWLNRVLTKEEFSSIKALPKILKFKRGDLLPTGKIFYSYQPENTNGMQVMSPESYKKYKDSQYQYNVEYKKKYLSDIETYELKKKKDREYNKRKSTRERQRVWQRKRRDCDPLFKIRMNLTTLIGVTLRQYNGKKNNKTIELLGCSITFFKEWIEFQFEDGMTWKNYGQGDGKWNYDHLMPRFRFNLLDRKEALDCFNWKNTRPMWVTENISKGKSEPSEAELSSMKNKIQLFLNQKNRSI